ncbi:ABC transporter permease [Flavobacterium agricola]|uniref:ABC transporter permease n=1 Tax=Flavobacterium agricola TaxID=2870839 RepID=A0ABY6M292_9FLAO|nr:ABC transporter permease [Flavobacterium agricola]UYW00998.1 ABC transporter permease [Flavobacterium agricola]
MLNKLFQAIKKEMLLLSRDLGGLITLFIMPIVLVITVTLIQKSSFETLHNDLTHVIWVDNDKDSLSFAMQQQIEQANIFKLVTTHNKQTITEDIAQQLVQKGQYQFAIVIPEQLTHDLHAKVNQNVNQILAEFSFSEEDEDAAQNQPQTVVDYKEIKLFFDPALQNVYKSGVKDAIDKMVAQIENKTIYQAFKDQLGTDESAPLFASEPFLRFTEYEPDYGKQAKPNAVQHNVPAWTLFAIFFIMVPLSINMVKEKNQGTWIRLLTSPASNIIFIFGKTATYLLISLLQFYAMLLIGKFVFPYMGLPALLINNQFITLSFIAMASGLAAIGLGILLGTIAKTQEQAAPFGATFTIILAAIGGVWIPVFAMPNFMQFVAKISPMHWALESFYDVLLRQATFVDILPKTALLLLFFGTMLGLAFLYDKKKRHI